MNEPTRPIVRPRPTRIAGGLVALAAAGLTLLGMLPVGMAQEEGNPPRVAASEAELAELVAGNNAFAWALYGQINEEADDSFFLSPYSISTALGMTFAGARNNTETQMQSVLRYTLGQERIHPAFTAMNAVLEQRHESTVEGETGERPTLAVANSIWAQNDFTFRPEFVSLLQAAYGIEANTVDFVNATEAARNRINGWVSDHTEERIEELLVAGILTSLTRLVLTNTIFFKGSWRFPFHAARTADGVFYLATGEQATVPLMRQEARFAHTSNATLQAVQLPFVGNELAMLVVVPREGQFEVVEEQLIERGLEPIIAGLGAGRVDLTMPKYSLEAEFRLDDALGAMGMPEAFNPGAADFSGMAEIPTRRDNLYISAVVHKAFLEVDESGAEAAAATAVVISTRGARPASPTEIRVDRPFLVVIRDVPTGAILFLGRVTDPR